MKTYYNRKENSEKLSGLSNQFAGNFFGNSKNALFNNMSQFSELLKRTVFTSRINKKEIEKPNNAISTDIKVGG